MRSPKARRGLQETGHDNAGDGCECSNEQEDNGSHDGEKKEVAVKDGSGSRLLRGVRLALPVLGDDTTAAVLLVEWREIGRQFEAVRRRRLAPGRDGIVSAFTGVCFHHAFGEELHFVPTGENSDDGGNRPDERNPPHDIERTFVHFVVVFDGGGANVDTADR